MKIYTKTGDDGTTGLYGGTRVPKYNLRVESYGTIDELNAHIGLLRDQEISDIHTVNLLKVQNDLFTLGAMLATPKEKEVLKSGKKRRIKAVTYFKQCSTNADIIMKDPKIKSILKNNRFTNRKKKVTFDLCNNEVKTYFLSDKEKNDKLCVFFQIVENNIKCCLLRES